jgi:hypothetical protein
MTVTITPETSVMELVEHHPETEAVFERYTKRIGICICCECLFCSLKDVSLRYELDLDELMARLNNAIKLDLKETSCV